MTTATTTTTTKTNTTTNTQSGTKLTVKSQSNTQSIGNLVTGVNLNPYIAPRIISFYAYNMRPNTLLHVFFDGVNVDAYCASGLAPTPNPSSSFNNTMRPVTTAVPLYISGTTTPVDTSDHTSIPINASWGTPIYSDANGHVAGKFNIPAATFKTGDRVLQICDVSNLAQGNAAITTISTATFTASNLNVTRQATTLTTINPVLSFVPVTNTVISSCTSISNSTVVTNTPQPLQNYGNGPHNGTPGHFDPIAQSLTISTPDGAAGIYATGIDLFFEQKSLIASTTDNGVTVYICEMNNGYPDTSTVLPFSTTHLYQSQINANSANSQVATSFVFESPVFLNNNTEYAFVVKPDNSDPDYRLYTAVLGNIDLATGTQVYSQPVTGTAFYGATAGEWTALQTEYIKFTLYAAQFSNGTGDAYFNNDSTDFINLNNLIYPNTALSVLPGDYVYQSTNSTVSTVNTSIVGVLNYYDTNYQRFYVGNSSGNFTTSNGFIQVHRFANASALAIGPNTSTLIATSNTNGLVSLLTDAVVGQFSTIVPSGTSLTFDYKGVNNTNSLDTNSTVINSGYETEFKDYSRLVMSKTYENNLIGGSKSMTIHANMTTDSPYLSPAIDLVRRQELILSNRITPVETRYSEFYNSGTSTSKYISQVVALAPGQDAQDLQVIISANRPVGSDIKVYVKFLNGEDSDSITQKTWTPLVNQNPNFYSSPGNSLSFNDFVFSTQNTVPLFITSGTVSTNATSGANVTGSTGAFSNLSVGWWITVPANTTSTEAPKQIISIANGSFLTLSSAFSNTYTNSPFLLVAPPTTAYMAANTLLQVAGTVSVSTTNNAVIGTGTNFTAPNLGFMPGSIISVAGDEQVVVSVANSTYLTVGTPWLTTATGANAYIQTNSGLTYQNSKNNLFTNFLSFQIKVVLQSNDSSNVPIMDNLRALALQL